MLSTSAPDRDRAAATRSAPRALLLLAVYALFVLLPGAHRLGHEHGLDLSAGVDDLAPPSAGQACGADCTDPFHHHHAHGQGPCALCVVLHWLGHPRPDPAGAVAAAAPAPALHAIDQDYHTVAVPAGAGARGPPLPFAS